MRRLFQIIETYWLVLSLGLLLLIATLSLWPLDILPLSVPGSDKLHHFIAYLALVFPAALRQPRRWILVVIFFILCSGLIELVQPYVNRYGEWLDMLANITGVVCGVLLATGVRALTRHKG